MGQKVVFLVRLTYPSYPTMLVSSVVTFKHFLRRVQHGRLALIFKRFL